jgi:hypothetical protein
MFFGLTSPNIIVFDLITFVIFFVVKAIQLIKEPKVLWKVTLNLLIAAIGVVLLNLYWLIPYVLDGAPSPGYVITQSVVDMLAQGVSLPNFLLGQADWFINQGNLGILETNYSSVVVVQVLGCVLFYVIALFTLFKYIQSKYRIPLLIILLSVPLLILDFIPFHDEIFQMLVFSKFGWIFREINRLSFFWYFWIFILFILGTYSIYEEILLDGKFRKFMKLAIFPIVVIPFIVYIFPINVQFFKYLKPVEISSDIEEVFEVLKEDDDFYSVYYFPRIEPYSINWIEDRFEIADVVDYISLTYNSPKPPVYNGSVIANAKSYQTLMTEYLFDNRDEYSEFGKYLDLIGVKYVVVRKDAEPITLEDTYFLDEVLAPMAFYLDGKDEFEMKLENDGYILYENKNFTSGVVLEDNTFYSTDSFSILERIAPEDRNNFNVKFCNFPENQEICYENTNEKTFLKFEDNEYFYIDFIPQTDREKYGIYTYDHVYDHKVGVNWGRGSMYDKINGELHNVLRNYGVSSWNFDLVDKFAYSDNPSKEDDFTSSVSFMESIECVGECEVYILSLDSHIGGDLTVNIDDLYKTYSTKSNAESFRWKYLGTIDSDGMVDVNIINKNGFAAIGGILVLPSSVTKNALENISNYTFIDIPTSGYVSDLPLLYNTAEVKSYNYTPGLVPTLNVDLKTSHADSLNIKSFSSDFFFKEKDSSIENFRSSKTSQVPLGESQLDIAMIGQAEIFNWTLFLIDWIFVIVLLISLI